MSKKNAGYVDGVMGQPGLDPQAAIRLAHRTLMTAAKNTTAIAYIDGLNATGQEWLRGIGMNVSFKNEAIIYGCRLVFWNGTPYMNVDDLAQCLALLQPHNTFDPEVVFRGLNSLTWRHPSYEFCFSLAREFSPALYIREVNYHRLDQIELAMLGAELQADSADYASGGDHRLWWD